MNPGHRVQEGRLGQLGQQGRKAIKAIKVTTGIPGLLARVVFVG